MLRPKTDVHTIQCFPKPFFILKVNQFTSRPSANRNLQQLLGGELYHSLETNPYITTSFLRLIRWPHLAFC